MSNYPLLDLFWTMLEFFLWLLWLFLLFKIITDVFRSPDLSGWGKAGWVVLLIVLPLIGALIYLIARGRSMGDRDVAQAKKADDAFKQYIRDAANNPSDGAGATAGAGPSGTGQPGQGRPPNHVDELSRLADLRARSYITDEEFQKAKDKLLV